MKLQRTVTYLFFYILGLALLTDSVVNKNIEFIVSSVIIYYFYQAILHQLVLHRYFSHHSFKLGPVGDFICYFLSILSAAGSPRAYAFVHKMHHAHTDTNNDPHGPIKGYFTLFRIHEVESRISSRKYHSDPWYSNFFNNHYYFILWAFVAILYLINANVLYYYVVATFLQFVCVDFFNYVSHLKNFPFNYRNYNTKDNSHNNVVIGFFASDWHNNHHNNPKNLNYSHRWWEIDLLYILFIKWMPRG